MSQTRTKPEIVTILHKDVQRGESSWQLLRHGTYPLCLSVIEVSYVAVDEDDCDEEVNCDLEFFCYHGQSDCGDPTVHIVGLRGLQVAINDFLKCRKHYELNRNGSRLETANIAIVDYYHETIDDIDWQLRAETGLDQRDEKHAIATVSL